MRLLFWSTGSIYPYLILMSGTGGGSPPVEGGVFYVSTTGSDGNTGSEASPWLTPTHALGEIGPGDTLVFEDGEYAPFSVSVSGSAGNPITLKSKNLHQAHVTEGPGGYASVLVSGNYITIDGLRVSNYSRHGIEFQFVHHCTVVNCWMSGGGGNGIGALEGDFYHFENNLCEGWGRTGWNSGISIYHPDHRGSDDEVTVGLERNIIRNNICRDNHMLSYIAFDTGGVEILQGDIVTLPGSWGIADRIELTSGSWGAGTAAGRVGLKLREFTTDPDIDDEITVDSVLCAVVTADGFFQDEGLFTDGNGIILDDWDWSQNPEEGYSYPFGALVEGNISYQNGGKGIQFYGVVGPAIGRNNTLYANNLDAIMSAETWRGDLSIQDSDDVTLANNISYATPGPNVNAIGIYGGNIEATLYNNLTFNGTDGIASIFTSVATYVGSGDITGINPHFVDPENGDFRVASNSAAVDAADETQGFSTPDLNGDPRSAGFVNIGALEAVGSAYVPPARGDITDVGTVETTAYGTRVNSTITGISGLQENDVVYVYEVMYRGFDGFPLTVTPPEGFEEQEVHMVGLVNAAGWLSMRVWRKILGAADPLIGNDATFTHASSPAQYIMQAFRGVDLSQPEDTLFFGNTGSQNVREWEPLTTFTENARLIAYGVDYGEGTTPAGLPAVGMTERVDVTLSYLADITVEEPTTVSGLANNANSAGTGENTQPNGTLIFAVRAALA